jgi:hypothetical protein
VSLRDAWLPLIAAAVLGACGHSRARAEGPSSAEARAYHYQDSSGLLVGTYGVAVRQRLPARTTVEARALADYVRVDPGRGFDPTRPGADRRAPDAVTSASATVGGGEVATKWRVEGQLGFDLERDVAGAPSAAGIVARASHEPDYRSLSVAARGATELADRNTAIALLVGYGRDEVDPVEAPRGNEALWPDRHQRWAGNLNLSQILSRSLVFTAGAAATWQSGMLSSPYRRAVVQPSLLLPESLPRSRDRYSGFLGLSASINPDLAVHIKQGVYLDSWSVRALVPEIVVAAELAPGAVLQTGYRLYAQSAASFYRATYQEAQTIMAGDPRLGPLLDHNLSFELRRMLHVSARLQLPLLLGYQISVLSYRDVGSRVVAHVFMLGLAADH